MTFVFEYLQRALRHTGVMNELHAKRKVSQQGVGINLHGLAPLYTIE
jgi:hypothetical protein